jgi:hypothetical protein
MFSNVSNWDNGAYQKGGILLGQVAGHVLDANREVDFTAHFMQPSASIEGDEGDGNIAPNLVTYTIKGHLHRHWDKWTTSISMYAYSSAKEVLEHDVDYSNLSATLSNYGHTGRSQIFDVPENTTIVYEPMLAPKATYLGTVNFELPYTNSGKVQVQLIMHEILRTEAGVVATVGNNSTARTLNLPQY